jgi:colicin import membrane protein
MTATQPQAFLLSAALHVLVAGLILLFTFGMTRESEMPQIIELVAGEGDNFAAAEAPALGGPGGIKVNIPNAPEPAPAPPEPVTPVTPVASPILPAPAPKAAPAPAPPKPADPNSIVKDMRWAQIKAESRAKMQLAREKAAEKKRLEEEKKRMTKAQFDAANRAKAAAAGKPAPVKVAKIDAEGIAKGVVGGSTANRVGGAGGKALRSDATLLEGYFALLKQRVRAELTGLAGMDDRLTVDVLVRISAAGVLSNPRVKKSSGNAEFDNAVLAALRRVRMPEHPEKKSEELELTFRTRDIEGG